jgi:dTDP-4-amino-4,6-dideoxygalactose transaminase
LRIPLVNLQRQHSELRASLQAAMDDVFASGAFISGPFVAKFEQAFAEELDVGAWVIGVSNGTSAISLVLEALGVGSGDEVILPAHTFAATAEAVRRVGATPVFCDIDPLNYTANPTSIASLANDRTRAVIAVHLYGSPADLQAIRRALPQGDRIAIIEDSAQAHLARYRGTTVGTIGLAGTFSFFPGKNLGACGDAGAVVTLDGALAERVAKLRDHGRHSKYEHDIVGYNERMDGIQGAILSAKLPRLRDWNRRRREIAAYYDSRFQPAGFKTIVNLQENQSVYHLYVVEVSNRDEVCARFRDRDIATGIHYPLPLHMQPAFRGWSRGALSNTERIAERVVSLPICPYLSDSEAEEIAGLFLVAARP